MLLRIFKGTGPGVILLIVITLLLLWAGAILHPQSPPTFNYEEDPMPLYGLLKLAIGHSSLLGVLFSFALVVLLALLLVHLNTVIFFINERTFLPALFFILFSAFIPQNQLLNPVLPAAVFLMLALNRIMDGYRKPGVAYNFFDAALLISTGSLFYANLIWFGVLVLIGIAILRTGSLIEIFISVLGLLTPYIITFGFYYVTGNDLQELITLTEKNLFSFSADYEFSRLSVVTLISAGIEVIISAIYLFLVISNKKIKSRKTFSILFWTFLLSVVLYLAVPSVSMEIFWVVTIPSSYFLAHYFVFAKGKLFPEVLFSLLILLVLIIQVWYLYT